MMRLKCVLLLLSFSLISFADTYAQQVRKAIPRDIFEALEGDVPGEGRIVIKQSQAIKDLVGGVSSRFRGVVGREGNTTLVQGYRIQLYHGNLSTSKAELERRAAVFRRLAPEYNCYTSYNAPFWRLVAGDFIDSSAAQTARKKLTQIMPSWFKECYVVRDRVRIINYNQDNNE